jgi:4-carboxymuconolactone decarboxylase
MDAASELRRLERGGAGDGSVLTNRRLRAFFECWLDTFVFQGGIDPRLRELTILRVMWRTGRVYEWSNHYRLAHTLGISDEDVLAVRTHDPARDLAGPVGVVARAADEVVDMGRVTPATMADLEAIFPEEVLRQEFLYVCAGYRMFAIVSASSAESHDGAEWLPDGVGPKMVR